MSSLIYLLSKKAKNRIREALHRPSEIIVIILFLFLMFFTFFAGETAEQPTAFRSMDEFYAIVLALYAMIFVLSAKSGFVNGASMFSMADVNLLFPSPQKPRRLLTFGLLSQLGRSLMLGFFILYQYTWAHDAYGISLPVLFAVLIGYGVTVFLSQMLAMVIYSFTAGSDKKNNICKAVFYIVIAAFAGYVIVSAYLKGGELIPNIVSAANSVLMKFFPVAGFVQLGVTGVISGKWTWLAISIGCVVAFCGLYYALISMLNSDYYEDVLKATEVSFSAITARKEGKAIEVAPRNVKLGKTGLKKGEGASAIAEKHKIENRRSKILLLDITSIVFIVITIAFAWIAKDVTMAFVFNIYMSLFVVGTGRWAKELILPYVYLIPEPPFKKLINMLKEQIPSMIAESVVTFVPLYFLTDCTIGDIVGMVVAKISFSFLFIGVNLILQRFFGNGGNKVLIMFLYVFMAMLACVPSIAVYAVMAMTEYLLPSVTMLIMAAVNALISIIIIFCCRNILQTAEYNNK
ncbi:MAG: putative ABC exporter domain-containing protein [Faecalibacterium sp.]|nr:putative ABC exporter domain-containing protein [Ruminococcus sp.]MCM1392363.1 putative ABC exporter domain-containing protein [Ruminococcus sp.]MCM1485152.1 putative ABC exporter domain-containing protein [Faecalibacterium sp.]